MIPVILAATVAIGFEGLMFFQTRDDGSKHVAIVDARHHYHHDPNISIWEPDGKGGYRKKEPPYALYKGDRVTFSDTRGEVSETRLYRNHMPKLRKYIFYGDVDPDVGVERFPVNGVSDHDDGALAFVNFPAGEITTWGTFRDKVRLKEGGFGYDTKCFARFVVLTTQLPTVRMTIYHASPLPDGVPPVETYDIKPPEMPFVSNISDDKKHLHFPAYAGLLTLDGQLGPIKLLKESCTPEFDENLQEYVKAALKATHRAPNGDCGPTGP